MPPKANTAQGPSVSTADVPSAVFVRPLAKLVTIAKRADFLKTARAKRSGQPGFLLQARFRDDDTPDVRIGFTCSKKIGNAVARNRAKRRLREIARHIIPEHGQAGWDYVLVGRPNATISRDYAQLLDELRRAMGKIHA